MCGLSCIFFHPGSIIEKNKESIKEIFVRNHLFNQERGKEASGIALIKKNGQYYIYKDALTVKKLAKKKKYKQILDQLDGETICLLGHTREPTKGSPHNNCNNHPLLVENIVGIHNGHISNDDDLFKQFKLPRDGEVDSEIIFRMFDTIKIDDDKDMRLYLQQIYNQTKLLQGNLATISLDLRIPEYLLVIKRNRPLCIHYHKEWQAIFLSSRYLFLRKAFGKQVLSEALPNDNLYIFNANNLSESKGQPCYKYPI